MHQCLLLMTLLFPSSFFFNTILAINLSQSDLKSVSNFGHVYNNDGWDIRFTSDDGTTLLDHELELYNASTGDLVAWVRLPSLKTGESTKIFLYFGNSSVDSDPSTPNTWSTNFRGVWHLTNASNDASQLSNHGINNGTTSISGKIGNARTFDGIDDYIRLNTNDLYDNLSQGTIIAWAKWSGTNFETIFGAIVNTMIG